MNESKKSKILIIALLYAINIWSQNSDSLVLCANTFALNSKFEESAEMYVAASDIDYNKGWLYEASKNYAKAKQKEKALSLLKRLSHLYYLDYDSLISTDVYFQYHHLREWQKIVKKVKKK